MANHRQKVWRWENRGVVPDRAAQWAIAAELGVDPNVLDHLRRPHWLPDSPARADYAWTRQGGLDALTDAQETAMEDRPGFLRLTGGTLLSLAADWRLLEPEQVVAAVSGAKIDAGFVEDLESGLPRLRRLEDQRGGSYMRRVLDAELALVTDVLARSAYTNLTGRDGDATARAARELRDRDLDVAALRLDVTDGPGVDRAIDRVARERGRIDILVNNAGIAVDNRQHASAPDWDRVRRTLDTNTLGAWRCCAAAVPHTVERAYGRIVNVTSHLGSLTTMDSATNVGYSVSKAALNAVTRVLAADLADTGVLINAASPGRMNTRMAWGETDRTAEDGAASLLWLTALPDDGPTGGLFHGPDPLHGEAAPGGGEAVRRFGPRGEPGGPRRGEGQAVEARDVAGQVVTGPGDGGHPGLRGLGQRPGQRDPRVGVTAAPGEDDRKVRRPQVGHTHRHPVRAVHHGSTPAPGPTPG
jgi:NAD(P)-dependent dehydrogenase (short-subunit alcohol dehydrogenase family)